MYVQVTRAALLALLVACASSTAVRVDGGETIDGAADAWDDAVDAAVSVDGAPVDGAVVDAAVVDARPIDAAVIDAAVVDARPVDAAAPDAATSDACVLTWTALPLGNPGFDTAVAPWTQTGTVITAAAAMPIAPQAGTHAAWFGGTNNADDRLVQAFTVPAGAAGLRLRVYECFVTADTSGADDLFTADLLAASGAVVDTVRSATNLQVGATCAWTAATWTAAAAHAGQTLTLDLRGTTDASFPTSWYVDTVVLEALLCP